MSANFVRLTVIADDHQLDVSLPAQRPVVEYIDDVLGLLGPSRAPVNTAWTLSTPTRGPIDLEDTLSDHSVHDGAQVYLTKAPDAAPPPFVDDVLAEMRREVDGRNQAWTGEHRRTWIGLAMAVIVVICGGLIVADDARWAVAGTLGAVAVLVVMAGISLHRNGLGNVLWAAVPLAAAAAWRAGEASGLVESITFALAAAGLTGCIGVWRLRGSSSAATALAAGGTLFGVAGAGFVAGMSPTAASVWVLPVLVVAVIMAPRLALTSSGLIAQIRLSERMELAQREAVAAGLVRGRRVVDVLVWVTSAFAVAAIATIALTGVWEQGLAAAVLVVVWLLRSRNFAHTRHVAPMVVAAAAGAAFLSTGLARWLDLQGGTAVAAVGGVAALGLAVLFAFGAISGLDEVTSARIRRFLDAVDLPLAIAFVPVVFFAQGVYALVWPN